LQFDLVGALPFHHERGSHGVNPAAGFHPDMGKAARNRCAQCHHAIRANPAQRRQPRKLGNAGARLFKFGLGFISAGGGDHAFISQLRHPRRSRLGQRGCRLRTGQLAADLHWLGRTNQRQCLTARHLLAFDHIDPHHCAGEWRSDRNPGLRREGYGSGHAAEGDVIDLPCSHGLNRQPLASIRRGGKIAGLLFGGRRTSRQRRKRSQNSKRGDEVRGHA